MHLVSKRAIAPGLISATTLPVELKLLEFNCQSAACERRNREVKGAVMTLTVRRHLSRELQYKILDACAARYKRSGGVIVYALAAWFTGFILLLAYVLGKLATLGFLTR